jgi:NADH-quinone oxidoreductase subunit E
MKGEEDSPFHEFNTVMEGIIKEGNGLISVLMEVQKRFGYLPKEILKEVARTLNMDPVDVWGVVTFFNLFRLKPLGKNQIKVCMGTACHLAGGRLVLETLERELDLKVGDTSLDGKFSLERVACIGCCMLAPVMVINERIYPKMTPFKVEEALIEYRQEKKGRD